MFNVFIEVTLQIVREMGPTNEVKFFSNIIYFLETQILNVENALGTKNFDEINDLEGSIKKDEILKLSELCEDERKLNIVQALKT
jgi:hypothetical protein